jgi:hypothetical protein
MLSEATVGELMRFIPMHPSIGEALVDAAMDVEIRPDRFLPKTCCSTQLPSDKWGIK